MQEIFKKQWWSMVNHVQFVAKCRLATCEQTLHWVKKLGRRETVPFSWYISHVQGWTHTDYEILSYYICFVKWLPNSNKKSKQRLSRKCCFAFSHKSLPNVLHLYLRHIALVGNFTILKFATTFLFISVLR